MSQPERFDVLVLGSGEGGVFTSTATQHGGQEPTIMSFHSTLLHQGIWRKG